MIAEGSLLRVIEDLEEAQGDTPTISDAAVDVAVKRLHPSHGAALLQCWNLPEVYQRVVADHHGELPEADDVVLLIVRLVDRACARNGLGERNEPDLALEGCDEANLLGVHDLLRERTRNEPRGAVPLHEVSDAVPSVGQCANADPSVAHQDASRPPPLPLWAAGVNRAVRGAAVRAIDGSVMKSDRQGGHAFGQLHHDIGRLSPPRGVPPIVYFR